jgi:hypothetical protein
MVLEAFLITSFLTIDYSITVFNKGRIYKTYYEILNFIFSVLAMESLHKKTYYILHKVHSFVKSFVNNSHAMVAAMISGENYTN